MSEGDAVGSSYNYEAFDEHVRAGLEIEEFGAFPNLLRAGEEAPDFEATDLDGESKVAVSSLWRRKPLVVEFGSFT